jgi:5-methylthioadenosine/S-adenosylhomocysteine deaminase
MRDRRLLTVDVPALQEEADAMAKEVDQFLIRREESVLSKLVAIGGVAQERSFEVQVKIKDVDLAALEQQLRAMPAVQFVRDSARSQYDTYFLFDDEYGSRIRYREDEIVDPQTRDVIDIIYRMTLTTTAKEREFANSVLLSRSRFDATAPRSRRFYQEYFKPDHVVEVHKFRRRFHIRYGDTDFAINFDEIRKPEKGGVFFEIKSRTWSRQDAERKAALIGDLLRSLGVPESALVKAEYLDLAQMA